MAQVKVRLAPIQEGRAMRSIKRPLDKPWWSENAVIVQWPPVAGIHFAVRSGLELPGNQLFPKELEADPVSHQVVVVSAILFIWTGVDLQQPTLAMELHS